MSLDGFSSFFASVFLREGPCIEETGGSVEAVHKTGKRDESCPDGLVEVSNNDRALGALSEGKVVGGTAWLWARARR